MKRMVSQASRRTPGFKRQLRNYLRKHTRHLQRSRFGSFSDPEYGPDPASPWG